MPNFNTFIFDIVCDSSRINLDYIRRTFIENGYDANCYIDYHTNTLVRCHVHSVPFILERIHDISSRFPCGIFIKVRILCVSDIDRFFEHTFFVKIARSFPIVSQLIVMNSIEQIEKPSLRWNKSKETSSNIEYPYLTQLSVSAAHIDYVEIFLSNFNTRLPLLNRLRVKYEYLLNVTNNFTRNATRMNCSK